MITRVTTTMTAANTLNNMQSSARKLAELQDKAASREAIRRPSDDPAATNTALATRAELSRYTQFERNLRDADTWMRTIDSALGSASDIIVRVQELALQAGNDTVNESGRKAIAAEVDQLREQMLSLANSQVLGRNVFAGTHAGEEAYSGTPLTWNGTPGSTVERRITDSATVRVDVPGPEAFGNGADSVFNTFENLSAAVRSGGDVSGIITALEANRENVLDARTVSGARHTSVMKNLDSIQLRLTELESTRMAVEEEDLAESAIQLQTQQLYYQAALSVTAKALTVSLMDYLR